MKPRILAGASGYSFKEWKGNFYPDKIRPDAMLAYYAQRLDTVEINSSFYALPKAETVARWADTVAADFRFSVKAPQAISHHARLAEKSAADVTALYDVLECLGGKRGPVLFQLPPTMKKDLPRLREFIGRLPQEHGATFEFRHDSWLAEEVYDCLREAGAALCQSEREDATVPPLLETASWGYLRLRLDSYSQADLQAWLVRLRGTAWKTVYVYFRHEITAPGYAAQILDLARGD